MKSARLLMILDKGAQYYLTYAKETNYLRLIQLSQNVSRQGRIGRLFSNFASKLPMVHGEKNAAAIIEKTVMERHYRNL